jgi:ABC-type lipoprotein export system ATPase subunit
MFQLEGVTKIYKQHKVLDGVDWNIPDGAFAVLTGRSGGGKTTLLSVMGGLARADAGRVLLDGVDIWRLPEPELAALRNTRMGFVFQFPSLLPTLKVLDNVLLPIALGDAVPTKADKDLAEELLELVGVYDKSGHYPAQLSGGQQRRVAIARALIKRPAIIFADEPTGDLDEKTEAEIMGLFKQLNQRGVSLIMATHALNYVEYGQALTLKDGRLEAYDKAEVGARQGDAAAPGETASPDAPSASRRGLS